MSSAVGVYASVGASPVLDLSGDWAWHKLITRCLQFWQKREDFWMLVPRMNPKNLLGFGFFFFSPHIGSVRVSFEHFLIYYAAKMLASLLSPGANPCTGAHSPADIFSPTFWLRVFLCLPASHTSGEIFPRWSCLTQIQASSRALELCFKLSASYLHRIPHCNGCILNTSEFDIILHLGKSL